MWLKGCYEKLFVTIVTVNEMQFSFSCKKEMIAVMYILRLLQ